MWVKQFPPELLLRIFRLCASSPIVQQRHKNWSVSGSKWYSWLSIGLVCRLWRSLLLQESYCWSFLYLPAGKALISLALTRSNKRHLTLVVDDQYMLKKFPHGLDPLMDVLGSGRVVELHYRFANEESEHLVLEDPRFQSIFHGMTVLNLSTTVPFDPDESDDEEIPFPSKDSLLYPKLRELNVRSIAVQWKELSRFPSLQILSLNCAEMESYMVDIMDVLGALGSMPLLRDLYLALHFTVNDSEDLNVYYSDNPLQTQIVSLPQLESFSLLSKDSHTTDLLLKYVRFPGTTKFKIMFDEYVPYNAIGAKLAGTTTLTIPEPIDKFYIFMERFGPFFFRGRAGPERTLVERGAHLPYSFELGFAKAITNRDRGVEWMKSTLFHLPLKSVRCLSISSGYGDSLDGNIYPEPSNLAMTMPNVEVLRLTGTEKNLCVLEELLGYAVNNRYSTEAGEYPKCMFPRLRALDMRGFVFRLCGHHSRNEDEHYGCAHALLEVLEFRKKQGCAPVEHLRISRCFNIGALTVKRLEALVPRITWDGNVRIWKEDSDLRFHNEYRSVLPANSPSLC